MFWVLEICFFVFVTTTEMLREEKRKKFGPDQTAWVEGIEKSVLKKAG